MAAQAIAKRHGIAPWRRRFQGVAVEGAIGMWEREGARLLKVRRAVDLIEEAFRGRRFRARL